MLGSTVSLGNPSQGWPFSRELRENLRELRRSRRQGGCSAGCTWTRTDDSRLPWSTGGRYGGWGGHRHHDTDAGAERTPVVFVHGNQRDACDWRNHAEFFLKRGYRGDELWAITFEDGSPSHDAMAVQLDAFVARVREHADAESVAVVAHSLGVTGARHWLAEYDRYDAVETFVGLAGANHGTVLNGWCADAGLTDGTYKMSSFLRPDYEYRRDHPLARLNADETPGDVDYYTVRGTEDPLFWRCEESPELEGATNVALDTDHDGVRADLAAKELIFEWIAGFDPYDLRHQVVRK